MPSPLVVGSLYSVRTWLVQAEQAAVNTVYYLVQSTTGNTPNDTDLARVFEVNTEALYKGITSTDVTYRGVQVSLDNPKPPSGVPATVFSNVFAGPGSLTPPDCPRQISGLIEWTTNFSGKRYRGHTYVPFPAVAHVATDGVPTATYQTGLLNLANAILGFTSVSNVGATGTASIALYLHHRAGKTPIPNATPITGKVVPAKFANQRRRGSYGRPNNSPI
jgi:hypothetical protein